MEQCGFPTLPTILVWKKDSRETLARDSYHIWHNSPADEPGILVDNGVDEMQETNRQCDTSHEATQRPSVPLEAEKIRALDHEARRLAKQGYWGPDAWTVNSEILRLDSGNLAALNRFGRCHEEVGDLQSAREYYSRALRAHPEGTVAKKALGRITRRLKEGQKKTKERAERQRRREEASFQHAQRKAQDEARRRVEWQRRQEEASRRVGAITSFKEARDLGVMSSKARPKDYALAIAALQRAYRLDPRRKVKPGEAPDPGLFVVPTRLAAVYREIGQTRKARELYEWVLKRQESRYARVGLAAVLEDEGKSTEALALYEEVLERSPNDSYALKGIARSLSKLGRIDEAIEAYESAATKGDTQKDTAFAVDGLQKIRVRLADQGQEAKARRVGDALRRLGAEARDYELLPEP